MQKITVGEQFEKLENVDKRILIEYNGARHQVDLRFSLASEDTIPKDNIDRGNKVYGEHAAKNAGLSIVREERKLELDPCMGTKF